MNTSNLFTAALNLENPWEVSKVDFVPSTDNPKDMELHIWLAYPDGSKFPCAADGCKQMSPIHDQEERTWRHLNFFQYKTYMIRPSKGCHGKKSGDFSNIFSLSLTKVRDNRSFMNSKIAHKGF